MAIGRPSKPYKPTWGGDPIPGLYRCPDGRWRINATGQKFTEHDERAAIARFKRIAAEANPAPFTLPVAEAPSGTTTAIAQAIEAAVGTRKPQYAPVVYHDGSDQVIERGPIRRNMVDVVDDRLTISQEVDEAAFWAKVHELLFRDPVHFARMAGAPGLSNLLHTAPPKDIKLATIIENYRQHNASTEKAKREAINPLERLIKHAGGAKTLDDLTTDKLLAFKAEIEKTIAGPTTRRAYYLRIRSVIAFGLKTGMDAAPIRATLDRCKVLWTAEPMPPVKPMPIAKDQFHKLLANSNGTWRAWLLVGLNLCLHIEEVCDLKWEDFDLDKGTYACIRNKTRRQRIPRAATLWPETVAELNKIKRTGSEYVFISKYGTRYNRNTRIIEFKDMRIRAGLPEWVTYDTLRDGSYTAACQGADDRLARLLAGHKSPGMQDNYVLRHPKMVRPACDAVYKVYGPF